MIITSSISLIAVRTQKYGELGKANPLAVYFYREMVLISNRDHSFNIKKEQPFGFKS